MATRFPEETGLCSARRQVGRPPHALHTSSFGWDPQKGSQFPIPVEIGASSWVPLIGQVNLHPQQPDGVQRPAVRGRGPLPAAEPEEKEAQ